MPWAAGPITSAAWSVRVTVPRGTGHAGSRRLPGQDVVAHAVSPIGQGTPRGEAKNLVVDGKCDSRPNLAVAELREFHDLTVGALPTFERITLALVVDEGAAANREADREEQDPRERRAERVISHGRTAR